MFMRYHSGNQIRKCTYQDSLWNCYPLTKWKRIHPEDNSMDGKQTTSNPNNTKSVPESKTNTAIWLKAFSRFAKC